jgi:uncharacterized protein (DUF1499 family)
VLVTVTGGVGSRFHWWHFGMGFTLLKWGVYIGIAAALASLIGLFAGGKESGRPAMLKAVIGLVISLPVVILPLSWLNTARSVPPIHDITTDTENPPQFDAILALRADAPNSVEYGGESIASQQQEAYPAIQPILTDSSPDVAFTAALRAAHDLGWNIVAQKPQQGRIEAVDTTFWFGFKDDVVIRIKAREKGSRVDIRSVSRVGRSDVGTNARRIREFIQAFHRYTD